MDRLVKAEVKEVSVTFARGKKCSATFSLTSLMHTMSVAVSLSTTNPIFSFPRPFSVLPPLSTSSFTLYLSDPSLEHPPLCSPPETIIVRSSMLTTGKTHQEDLCRLFSNPGPHHVFQDAIIPISLVGPQVVEFLISPPTPNSNSKTLPLEVAFFLSRAISGCDASRLNSLLKTATRIGNSHVVSSLIDAGADVSYRNMYGVSLMSLAVQSGNVALVQVFIEAGFVIDQSIDRFLHDAAANDRSDLMEVLCRGFADIDVNLRDSNGRTALHVAAICGHVEALHFLLSRGGDPDVIDSDGWSPLHCSAVKGHLEAVEILLNRQMFVKYAVTEEGNTAFALAAEKGHSNLYDVLHWGDELHRAARIGNIQALKICLAEGAEVNGRDQNGWTPLHRAAFKGGVESVKLLLGRGAQVDLVDDSGYTPLRRAVEAGQTEVALCLLSHGAKANVKGLLGRFEIIPLNFDRFRNHPSLVTSLCQEKEKG